MLSDILAAKSISYALMGGLAVSIRGRPRFTQDIDILLCVPQVALPNLLDELIKLGFDVDVPTVIRENVREHMTTLCFGSVRIDWLKPMLPLYHRTIKDATPLSWKGEHKVQVATAECLILTKLAAFRQQDQMDIETLLSANRDAIDFGIIRGEWAAVADAEDERTAWLESAIARLVPSKKE